MKAPFNKFVFLLVFFSGIVVNINAQPSITLYGDTTIYRNSTASQRRVAVQTNTNTDVFVSARDSFINKATGNYAGGMNIFKTAQNGSIIWSKMLSNGVPKNDPSGCSNFGLSWTSASIAVSTSGDIGVAATILDSCSFPSGPDIPSILGTSYFVTLFSLLDASGNVKKTLSWRPVGKTGTYSGGSGGTPNIIGTSDGGFLCVNDIADTTGKNNTCLLKIDANGNIMWQRTGTQFNYTSGFAQANTRDVIQTCDGGFLLVGLYKSQPKSLVTKLDANGNFIWAKEYNASGSNYCLGNSITEVNDGYIVTGYITNWSLANPFCLWVQKLDVNGTEVWSKAYSHPTSNLTMEGVKVVKRYMGDGVEILVPLYNRNNFQNTDFMLCKVDNLGNIVHAYQYSGSDYRTKMQSMSIDKCNGFRLYGSTNTGIPTPNASAAGELNTQLVRAVVDSSGRNGCETSITLASANQSTSVTNYTFSFVPDVHSRNLSLFTYDIITPVYTKCTSTLSATSCSSPVLCSANTVKNVTCPLGSDGLAKTTIINGTCPYTYLWSNSQTSDSLKNVVAGTYTVTITDQLGYTATTSVVISQPNSISFSASQSAPASCGNTNGVAIATAASGGSPGYSYSWSSNASGLTASNLSAGSYTVTVTDNSGCSATITVAILNTVGPNASLAVTTPIICSGNTGVLTATATSGTAPYTYSWSNSASGVTTSLTYALSNVNAGTYSVTVTDGNNCSITATVNLTEPPAIAFSAPIITDATCGVNNGAVFINASGGTGLLSYSWSNTTSGQTITAVGSGAYVITVTDANLCTSTTTVLVNNSPSATIDNVAITNLTCNASGNGSAIATASGGTPPLTYAWSNGTTGQTISSQPQGTYILSVTDASGCLTQSSVVLTQPNAISALVSTSISASCGNNNGSASITATGGTGTIYTYSWSNSQSSITSGQSAINGLQANTYSCTVTDQNSCSYIHTFIIGNKAAPVFANSSPTITPANCKGTSTGQIDVLISSGSAPYTFSWSNGPSSITSSNVNTQNNLPAGSYTISVTDADGCNINTVVSLTEPALVFTGAITAVNPTCIIGGNATVNISGGNTGNYTYTWSNGASAVTSTTNHIVNGLQANTYTVTVTDNKGCSTISTTTINPAPNAPVVQASNTTAVSCVGATDGTAEVTVSGTGNSYTYSWSNGNSTTTTSLTNSITTLTTNTYSVTITDNNGCSVTQSVSVSQPVAITLFTSAVDATCGNSNGEANVTTTGGNTGNYTYSWSNGISATTSSLSHTITSLQVNTYTITVTDTKGCSSTSTVTLSNVPLPTATAGASSTDITVGNSVTLNSSGGVSFTWTPADNLSCTNCPNPEAVPTKTTTYTVIVSDGNNCNDTAKVTIIVRPICEIDKVAFVANIFSPNNDGSNDMLFIMGNGLKDIEWSIYDRWGNLMFQTVDQSKGWDGKYNNQDLGAATFVYYIKGICIKTGEPILIKGNVSIVK